VATYGTGWPEGEISREKMLAIYSKSLITLGFGYINKTDLLGFKAAILRFFDGAAYLTTYHEGMAHCFLPDREMLFYSNEKDLAEKVKYYLNHPQEAIEIGWRAEKEPCPNIPGRNAARNSGGMPVKILYASVIEQNAGGFRIFSE